MAVAVYVHPKGMTRDTFNEVHRRLGEAGAWPAPGCLLHTCFGEEGDLMVYDIWESAELFQEFGGLLGPILAEIGLDAGEPGIMPLHRFEHPNTP